MDDDAVLAERLPASPPSREALLAANPPLADGFEAPLIWRIYVRGGEHPTSWFEFRRYGPAVIARFDHHDPPPAEQTRGIFYGALDGPTCVAEAFQRGRTVDCRARDPWLAAFRPLRPLLMLDLCGDFPTRIGASQLLNTTARRAIAREYSRAFYAAYDGRDGTPAIDGLVYPSSMAGGGVSVAIFERARFAIGWPAVFNRPLADPALRAPLSNAATRFGYAFVP